MSNTTTPQYHELYYHEDESIRNEFHRLCAERQRCHDYRDWHGKAYVEEEIFEKFGYQH